MPNKYPGKVRDTYDLGDRLLLITTDRQSGFDRMLGTIPYKGQVLNRTSLHWFEATRHIVPNHVISSPHANALLARKCRVLPIEFVVRGYLTGSTDTAIWTKYSAGERTFADTTLPDGMRKNEKLQRNLITPTTKESTHDRPIAPGEIISENWLTPDEWNFTSKKALALFAFGQQRAARHGLILVDTKYEFGVDARRLRHPHRRDPHARLLPLLARAHLRAAPRRRPRARHDRQRVLPPLVPRALRPLQR